jgi:GDPmannose 4,6-dehydratase
MTALITGITGQDGIILGELLVARGVHVIGTTRGAVTHARERMGSRARGVEIRQLDLGDAAAIRHTIATVQPTHIYHLAAPAAPMSAWEHPVSATDALCAVPARLLEAIVAHAPTARAVFAGSAQVFDVDSAPPQNEETRIAPRSPYGCGKAFSQQLVASFREKKRLHVSTAILFNHESGLRTDEYVTGKICHAVARIAHGDATATPLRLGALDTLRDWGHARDFMDAMIRMAHADEPDDYVIGTGVGRTVADFCEMAFTRRGLDWREHVVSDATFIRTGDARLTADASKAERQLGWRAETPLEVAIDEMLAAVTSP